MTRLHISRKLSQISFMAFFLLLPALNILRYDVDSKELYLFGSVWSLGLGEGFYLDPSSADSTFVAIRFVLKAVLPWFLALMIFPLLGFLLGRFFCGWLCPEGALFEAMDFLSLKVLGRRSVYGHTFYDPEIKASGTARIAYGVLLILFLLIIPPFFGVMLTGFFIAPERIFAELSGLSPSFGLKAGITGVTAYMLVSLIFVRHLLCKYACAPGLMQTLLGWISPVSLRVGFKQESHDLCTNCRKCERVCFMGVRPRNPKRDINCVNCGECITACRSELGDETLFDFRTGERK